MGLERLKCLIVCAVLWHKTGGTVASGKLHWNPVHSARESAGPEWGTNEEGRRHKSISEKWIKLADDRFLVPASKAKLELLNADVDKKKFKIAITSGKETIAILIDSKVVYEESGAKWNGEPANGGLHLVVLHPWQGKPMTRKHFKTSQPGEARALSKALTRILPGRLVVLVAVPMFVPFLDAESKSLMVALGSTMIQDMALNETWSMVYHTNHLNQNNHYNFRDHYDYNTHRNQHYTKRNEFEKNDVWLEAAVVGVGGGGGRGVPHSQVEVTVPRRELPKCAWEEVPSKHDLKEFCHTYDGYAELCRCRTPIEPHNLKRSAPVGDFDSSIPVALLTALNGWNFYRQVLNLLSLEGASETPIFVFIDGHNKELESLAALFNLPVHIHRPQGNDGSVTRLNMHFRFSVYNIFDLNPQATKAIILEDDLLLAPDFLRYFHATSPLLDSDPSVYCVNAFSVNSFPGVASNPAQLRRANAFPQFGWMVTRDWAREMIPLWVSEQAVHTDWDWWLGLPYVKGHRDVIVPEVSRTFHAGGAGAHVTGWEQAFYYDRMVYNQDPKARLDLKGLHRENYDKDLENKLKSATLLGEDFNPCDHQLLSKEQEEKKSFNSYKLMVKAESNDLEKAEGFLLVALCLHAHSRDHRDVYKGVQQYRVGGRTMLYVLGCPLSPFCKSVEESTKVMSPSDDLLSLAEERDFAWRSSFYTNSFHVRTRARTPDQEFAMRNHRLVNTTI